MSMPLQNTTDRQFRVETLVVRDGRRLGRARANRDGYYENLPVAVLGITTRNRTYYDIPSFKKQFTDPTSMLNQRLAGGQLYGEWGHPNIIGMREDLAIARLSDIQESNWSHHFSSIGTSNELSNGGMLVTANVCPTGPAGKSLKENLEAPLMNTAFSLRGITDAETRNGVSYRTMRRLITFDAVGAGGYFEASKLFSPGSASLEGLGGFDIRLVNVNRAIFTQTALENFSDSELNDYFGTSDVSVVKTVVTVTSPKERGSFKGLSESKLRAHYHEFIKE